MSLSWKAAINIFVLIAYDIIDRNATPASDTWYMQVAVCDFHAPVQKYQMASVERMINAIHDEFRMNSSSSRKKAFQLHYEAHKQSLYNYYSVKSLVEERSQ